MGDSEADIEGEQMSAAMALNKQSVSSGAQISFDELLAPEAEVFRGSF